MKGVSDMDAEIRALETLGLEDLRAPSGPPASGHHPSCARRICYA